MIFNNIGVLLLTIILLFMVKPSVQKKDYCKFTCKGIPNIACNHSEKPDKICNNFKRLNFGANEIKFTLDEHNAKRSLVALGKGKNGAGNVLPTAANMNELVWDEEMAYLAYLNALQCKMVHDKCRDTETQNGQNLFSAFTTASYKMQDVIKNGVQAWYNEIQDVQLSTIKNFEGSTPSAATSKQSLTIAKSSSKKLGVDKKSRRTPSKSSTKSTSRVPSTSPARSPSSRKASKASVKSSKSASKNPKLVVQASTPKMIGHFTQLIWAKSPRVGCAMVNYKEGKFNAYLFACNYVYGNVLRQTVYDSGPTGSACKSGVINGLCKHTE